MKIIFHFAADKELDEVFCYYANIDKPLAFRFWQEFQNGISRIQTNPTAWHFYRKNCRRYLLNRFPYAIVYRINNASIEIIAVMHLKRKPGYWTLRI